jgi:phosphoadenosine phosphosulfate reductase
MDGHLERAITAVDSQFGEGIGDKLFPPTKTIVMNKVSSLDSMFEIILDGTLVGRLRYDIPLKSYTFLPSLEGARRIAVSSKEKWVSCHEGVLEFLKDGANLLVPGIAGCDSGIAENDEVWVIDPAGSVIAVGIARMSGVAMAQAQKGFAVKLREVSDPSPPSVHPVESSWDDAVRANERDLAAIEQEAMSFVRRTAERNDVPVVVGFSGGKDSLATYLVVEKALGISPPVFFMDTGLELPETSEYVQEFAKAHHAEIIGQSLGDQFWESVDTFGPPARDFRWCCKVLKLGPAALSISQELGGGSLSFMGQRKLESFQRSVETRVS